MFVVKRYYVLWQKRSTAKREQHRRSDREREDLSSCHSIFLPSSCRRRGAFSEIFIAVLLLVPLVSLRLDHPEETKRTTRKERKVISEKREKGAGERTKMTDLPLPN